MVTVFDLDDTLYNEIDFVKSGFHTVASVLSTTPNEYFQCMWDNFLKEGSGTVFNHLVDTFDLSVSIDAIINIYRTHIPNITLSEESIEMLNIAKKLGPTALITDGMAQTQMQKFNVLGLSKWIDFPIFTDLYYTKKPNLLPFKMVMNHFPEETNFIYIADNPSKDFDAPLALGWKTLRYKNPFGIYRNLISNAHMEATDRKFICAILKTNLDQSY
jgi:putative hydrolase of the HAD superfamily